MRIGDVVIEGKHEELFILPRKGYSIKIVAEAVLDMEEFDSLQAAPVPDKALVGNASVELKDDKTPQGRAYITASKKHEDMRDAWLMVNSLKPSDIGWETVDPDDPSTCLGWRDELGKAGFTWAEIGWITRTVLRANSLDEAYLKECRDAFLKGQEELVAESSGPTEELSSTPSQEPASAGE